MKRRVVQLVVAMVAVVAFTGSAWAGEVVITPFGQSPDAMMVRVVLKKMKVSAKVEKLLKAADLNDEKVLIAVIGGSSKGLGAAGVDKDQEVARGKELFEAASKKGIKVLVMHIGGKGRRGKLSDLFITEAVPYANGLIVVDGGDHDGIFTNLLQGSDVKILPAPSVRGTSEPLKEILTQWGVIK